MAREWLLRGVNPEELQATPKDEGPQTPRSRWDNFWYHHKLKFWLITFAVVVLTILVVQLINKDDPDYRVLLMTEDLYSEAELAAMETLLQQYGEDLDGDGKVEVQIENCQYGAHVEQTKNSGIQTVQAHLMAADRMFFMMEPEVYDYFMKSLRSSYEDGVVDFFAPIDVEGKTLMENKTIWNWSGDTRVIAELREKIPNLMFGVRATKGTAGKATELYEQSMTLLENLITDQKSEN